MSLPEREDGHLRTMGVAVLYRDSRFERGEWEGLFDELENYANITQMAYIVTTRSTKAFLIIPLAIVGHASKMLLRSAERER